MHTESQILIIDDHPSFVEGVSLLLQSIVPNINPLIAYNGKDALVLLKQHPDIDWIFLDIKMPDINGIELIKHFEKNKTLANIVVMTSDNSPMIMDQVLKSNVSGFLSKDFDRQILSQAIETIANGDVFLTSEHERQLKNYRETLLRERQSIEKAMSHRQQDTLLLISKGYSNIEIAAHMGISESTVKTHVSTLMSLFEADNRTHCVAEAQRLHFI